MKTILLLLCSLPLFAYAQWANSSDTTFARITKTDCDDRIFTKVEVPPVVKGGEAALAEHILSYYKNEQQKLSGSAIYYFVLSKSGEITGITRRQGGLSSPEIFVKALNASRQLWEPAVQNDRKVCFEVKLNVTFTKEQALVSINM